VSQYTLNFEPTIPERFPTLREFVAYRTTQVSKPMKAQAADLDMAPSTLSRKLNPADGDTQRFNVDDLEGWLVSTGDAAAVVEYLAAKYLDSKEARQARIANQAERLLTELATILPALRAAA
jgi:phage/plasmid primase-like uncharacterized protein